MSLLLSDVLWIGPPPLPRDGLTHPVTQGGLCTNPHTLPYRDWVNCTTLYNPHILLGLNRCKYRTVVWVINLAHWALDQVGLWQHEQCWVNSVVLLHGKGAFAFCSAWGGRYSVPVQSGCVRVLCWNIDGTFFGDCANWGLGGAGDPHVEATDTVAACRLPLNLQQHQTGIRGGACHVGCSVYPSLRLPPVILDQSPWLPERTRPPDSDYPVEPGHSLVAAGT